MLKKYFEPGSLFSYPSYRNLWFSTVLTVLAMTAFPIAIAISVLDAGGSATMLGVILGLRILSGVLFAPIGGVWADRLPRRTILIAADGFRAVIGSIVVFAQPESIPFWVLGTIIFLMGVSDAFGTPAVGAIMPSILPDQLLPAGNVLRGIATRGATIAGPGIAGALIVSFNTHIAYIAISCFFLLGALMLFLISVDENVVTESKKESFGEELKEGLKVVWYYRWIFAMIVMATFQLMMVVGVENVLLPFITKRDFGTAAVYATAAALFSVGGMISAVMSIKFKVKNPGTLCVLIWGLFIIAPLVLAFPSSREVIYLAYFVAGFSVGPWEAYWLTSVQREVPAEYQARVFSIDYMGTFGILPLGMALAGPLADWLGERPLLVGISIFHLAICVVVLLVPGVKEMRSNMPPYRQDR